MVLGLPWGHHLLMGKGQKRKTEGEKKNDD